MPTPSHTVTTFQHGHVAVPAVVCDLTSRTRTTKRAWIMAGGLSTVGGTLRA